MIHFAKGLMSGLQNSLQRFHATPSFHVESKPDLEDGIALHVKA